MASIRRERGVDMDTIEKVAEFFKSHEVKCKVVRDNRQDYGDFIAIFSYGELTREKIVNEIKENRLYCTFFEESIREDLYKRKRAEQALER